MDKTARRALVKTWTWWISGKKISDEDADEFISFIQEIAKEEA